MLGDASRKDWLLSQYHYLVGQIQERDPAFPRLPNEELVKLNVHDLSSLIADRRELANASRGR